MSERNETLPNASDEAEKNRTIRNARGFYAGRWPDQLDSGVMFFEGQRITRDEFESASRESTPKCSGPRPQDVERFNKAHSALDGAIDKCLGWHRGEAYWDLDDRSNVQELAEKASDLLDATLVFQVTAEIVIPADAKIEGKMQPGEIEYRSGDESKTDAQTLVKLGAESLALMVVTKEREIQGWLKQIECRDASIKELEAEGITSAKVETARQPVNVAETLKAVDMGEEDLSINYKGKLFAKTSSEEP